VVSLECDDTITAGRYSGTFDRLWHATSHTRPGWLCLDIIILHNNARPHTANLTCDWLQCCSWEVTDLPPYTTNLTPGDFHLFGPLKGHFAGDLQQTSMWGKLSPPCYTWHNMSSKLGWCHGGANTLSIL